MGEFVATLALAQDNAFGQPLESQLRSCLLASWICDEAAFGGDHRLEGQETLEIQIGTKKGEADAEFADTAFHRRVVAKDTSEL